MLVDVVLAKPLGERRELALDRGRLLRLQLRRTELVVAGTWHAAQGGILARGVSGKNEANGGVVFAKGMPDLKLLAENGAARSPRLAKIPDIARIFRRQPASARYANRKRGRPARLPPQRFAKERGRCHKSDPSSTPVGIHA